MNSSPYVFAVDHVSRIKFGLSITVLEKKKSTKLPPKKVTLGLVFLKQEINVDFSLMINSVSGSSGKVTRKRVNPQRAW